MKPARMIGSGLLSIAALAAAAQPQGVLYSVTGPPGGQIGSKVADVGDLDGDGVSDFAVSDNTDGGSEDLYSGATGTLIHHLLLAAPPSGFQGGVLSGQGDVDLDGVPDILYGNSGAGGTGEVYVYSGATFTLIRTHVGPPGGNLYGVFGAMLGDLNGDGASEYAITAGFSLSSPSTFAEVRSGIDGQMLKTFVGAFAQTFATAYVALNDVTGDGTADFAYSVANLNFGGIIAAGEVRIISGATLDVWSTVHGTSEAAFLGYTMAPLGDVDGDGWDDFAASNFKTPSIASCPGLPGQCVNGVKVLSAATGAVLSEAYGDKHTDFTILLNPLSSTSDADGDGAADVLFADPKGTIDMAGSLSGKRLFEMKAPAPGTGFTSSVAGLGDVNGDGYPEFATGDSTVSPPGGQSTGTVWVMTTRPLLATPGTLSASAPGVVDFTLSPGVDHAAAAYLVLASATPEGGSCPGMDVGGAPIHIPFCFDAVMQGSVNLINTPVLQSTFGVLDPVTGQGSAKLDATGVPIPPSTVGLVIEFFFLTNLPGLGWDKVWQAEPVEIVP